MPNITPDTMERMVESRLVQTFRQYPRAGLYLSSSCRNTLLQIIAGGVFRPDTVRFRMGLVIEKERWTLQARLAWRDLFKMYTDAYIEADHANNKELLQAMSDGILAAGKIQVS